MTLKVNNAVKLMLLKQVKHQFLIYNIGLNKMVIGFIFNVLKILKVTGIGKRIEVIDLVVGVLVYRKRRTTCEPINPAPPVMRIFLLSDIFKILRQRN